MTTSKWEAVMMENMTNDEWKEFTQSDEYIQKKIAWAVDEQDARYWQRVAIGRNKIRNAEAWTEALEIAFNLADSETDLEPADRSVFIETLAESMMLKAEKIPPTWTSTVKCPLCGPMPCKPGRETWPCPWDITEIGRVARQSREAA